MIMESERKLLVKYGKKLIENKYTKGTGGNLSIFDRKRNLIAITPSGIDFFKTKPEDIVIIDLDKNIVQGNRRPSSEIQMHIEIYKKRPDINCVIHAHTMYSTVLSCLNIDLPAIHYVLATAGTCVKCAPYATYGSDELAKNAAKYMDKNNACLLANHGVVTGGKNIKDAFDVLEDVEYVSELYIRAKSIKEPVILSDLEMQKVAEKFKSHGQKSKK